MIEPEVMRHYGREELGVAIPEGEGYLGTLNVYHECKLLLVKLARWLIRIIAISALHSTQASFNSKIILFAA